MILTHFLLLFEDHLKIRPLEIDDYDRGYIPLLAQLTETGHVTREMYQGLHASIRLNLIYLYFRNV